MAKSKTKHPVTAPIRTLGDTAAEAAITGRVCQSLQRGTHQLEAELGTEVLLEAASGEAGGPRKITITAYTGGVMYPQIPAVPLVLDLAGAQVADETSVPIYMAHNAARILGQASTVITAATVKMPGTLCGQRAEVEEVLHMDRQGFRWKASLGAQLAAVEFVSEGTTAKANGRTFKGPVYIARQSLITDVSLVPAAGDGKTSAKIAAAAATGGIDMSFEQWLEAKGFSGLTDAQTATLRAAFNAEQAAAGGAGDDGPTEKVEAAAGTAGATPAESGRPEPANSPAPSGDGQALSAAAVGNNDADEAFLARRRRLEAAEDVRIAAIRELGRKYSGAGSDKLVAQAIGEGWDVVRTERDLLRAHRPTVPAVHVPDTSINVDLLEAACAIAGKLEELETHYDEKVLEAASRRFRTPIGLQQLFLDAARANGYRGDFRGHAMEVQNYAFGHMRAAGGFSNIDIGGILSNVSNKFLLQGFFAVERTWRNICSVRNVSDFKTVTSYRLIGKDQYEKVGPTGELKHGTLGEETYSNRAETYGLILAITRTHIIDDDLGAISTVPKKLGRGSGTKINDVFWAEFLDNAAFFAAGNKNYVSGADTVLSIDGLTKVEKMFMDMVDADGKPIGHMPVILLVSTDNVAMATQLQKATEIRDTTASTKYPTANPHVGKFRTEVSRYLNKSAYTGYSATAYYLLGDPNELPVIEVAFLNGQESPTIETADAAFNVLGVQMRGYHDFGVAKQDPKGGVKSKGAA